MKRSVALASLCVTWLMPSSAFASALQVNAPTTDDSPLPVSASTYAEYILTRALQAAQQVPYRQTVMSLKTQTSFSLTADGKNDKGLVSRLSTLSAPSTWRVVSLQDLTAGNTMIQISATPSQANSSAQDTAPQSVQEFAQGKSFYANTGSGWVALGNAPSALSPLNVNNLSNFTYQTGTGDSTQNPEDRVSILASFAPSTFSGVLAPLIQAAPSLPATPEITARWLSQATCTANYGLSRMGLLGGAYQVNSEILHLKMSVPTSMWPTPSDEKTKQQLKEFTGMTIDMTLSAAFSYDAIPVDPPPGLPSTS